MARTVLTICFAILAAGCSKGEKVTGEPKDEAAQEKLVFEDDFERAEIGPDWLDTGGGYEIVNGELRAQGAHNKPLWLKQKLPRDARVEFTARSMSPDVDIKVEVWGDGKSKATEMSYTATSYVFILGGWKNRLSIIARMDEHKKDRKKRAEPKGIPEKEYLFSITRKGSLVSWLLDNKPFLEMDDPSPLEGPGHEYFAINNWETEVYFDNLKIWEI